MKKKQRKKITISLEPIKPTIGNAFLSAGYLVGMSMREDRPMDDDDRRMLQKAGQYMRWFAEQMNEEARKN